MHGNVKDTCHYFLKMAFLSADSWTCMKTAHTPFKFGLLEFVLQTVWGRMLLTCTIFITTGVFWDRILTYLMLTRNCKSTAPTHTYVTNTLF